MPCLRPASMSIAPIPPYQRHSVFHGQCWVAISAAPTSLTSPCRLPASFDSAWSSLVRNESWPDIGLSFPAPLCYACWQEDELPCCPGWLMDAAEGDATERKAALSSPPTHSHTDDDISQLDNHHEDTLQQDRNEVPRRPHLLRRRADGLQAHRARTPACMQGKAMLALSARRCPVQEHGG